MKDSSKKDSKNVEIEDILKEIQQLSDRANESSNHQLDLFLESDLGDEDMDTLIDFNPISDIAYPKKSHRLYYGIQRLLIDNLPKGKENKKLRDYIYAEKNLFLKEGFEIGRDGRQSYIANSLELVFRKVTDWVQSGANSYDIFIEFRNLNESRGYR